MGILQHRVHQLSKSAQRGGGALTRLGHREVNDQLGGVEFTLTGFQWSTKFLEDLPGKQSRRIVRDAWKVVDKALKPRVKARIPRRKRSTKDSDKIRARAPGALRRGVTSRAMKRSRVRIGRRIIFGSKFFKGETFYGGFIEFGYRRGKRLSAGAKLHSRLTDEARPKVPAQAPIRKTVEGNKRRAIALFIADIKRGYKRMTGRNMQPKNAR